MAINIDTNERAKVINDVSLLTRGYIQQEGFVFTSMLQANVFDALVIRTPIDAVCLSPRIGQGARVVSECIELINQNGLEKAIIIGNDISFIKQCPSLKYVKIYPSSDCLSGFDYSPLYEMPRIKYLSCATEYGEKWKCKTTIDYSKIRGLEELSLAGYGHLNYQRIPSLLKLCLDNQKIDSFESFDLPNLKQLRVTSCTNTSINGIEHFPKLQRLSLAYMKKLHDISALGSVSKTLRSLYLGSCPKIDSFDCLKQMHQIEFLELIGNNEISNLDFLNDMSHIQLLRLTMNVLDGNLSQCRKIPYVDIKGRKHYNCKNKDLQKIIPSQGFLLY